MAIGRYVVLIPSMETRMAEPPSAKSQMWEGGLTLQFVEKTALAKRRNHVDQRRLL